MAQTKEFFTRIMQKHDTEANWALKTNFTPLAGEIIVYDKDSTHNYARVKIGDGTTKINNLPFTNTVSSVNDKTGAVKLSGYDVKAIPTFGQHNYNADECYDAGLYMLANGSGCPSGSQYGSLLSLPYRQANGNTTSDFGTQIFIPNGDDNILPNSLFYRTSLRDSWNAWQEVSTVGHTHAASEITSGTIAAARLPAATSSALGGVKIGSNISVSSGTISLSKANVTSALGYTPPTQDTTYSAATTSAAGLMSAADKSKLDGIATGANNYTYTLPNATSSTLGGVKIGSNISVSSGTISLSKANVTAALGYTPPTTDTTYSVATTSANGLMSSTDKTNLNTAVTHMSNTSNPHSVTKSQVGLGNVTNNKQMPIAGGTFTGNAWAYGSNRSNCCIRNIDICNSAGTSLISTNSLRFLRK